MRVSESVDRRNEKRLVSLCISVPGSICTPCSGHIWSKRCKSVDLWIQKLVLTLDDASAE